MECHWIVSILCWFLFKNGKSIDTERQLKRCTQILKKVISSLLLVLFRLREIYEKIEK